MLVEIVVRVAPEPLKNIMMSEASQCMSVQYWKVLQRSRSAIGILRFRCPWFRAFHNRHPRYKFHIEVFKLKRLGFPAVTNMVSVAYYRIVLAAKTPFVGLNNFAVGSFSDWAC